MTFMKCLQNRDKTIQTASNILQTHFIQNLLTLLLEIFNLERFVFYIQ